jgi:hypothetical protein
MCLGLILIHRMRDLNPYFFLLSIVSDLHVEFVVLTILFYFTLRALFYRYLFLPQRINFKQLHALSEIQADRLPVLPGIVFHLLNVYVPPLPLRPKSSVSLFSHI